MIVHRQPRLVAKKVSQKVTVFVRGGVRRKSPNQQRKEQKKIRKLLGKKITQSFQVKAANLTSS